MKYEIPQLTPSSWPHLTQSERLGIWLEMADAGMELVTARLRRTTNNEDELLDAVQDWVRQRHEEGVRTKIEMMRKFRERGDV
jgi:hypothetical protein